MLLRRGLRPGIAGFARNLPFIPWLVALEARVQRLAQRLQLALPCLPDHVDFGIIGNRFQLDMRHALIDEALADVLESWRIGLDLRR